MPYYEDIGTLDFSKRDFFVIPDKILDQIKVSVHCIRVNFSKNLLDSIPEEIKFLPFVEYIDVSFNSIKSAVISPALEYITYLDLSHNELTFISPEIFELKSLRILNVGFNKIKEIQNGISALKNLESINLESNVLTQISNDFCELNSLRHANFRNNSISHIPKNISDMETLETFNISFNILNSIEVSICKMSKLKELNVRSNPLTTPPLWVCSLGTEAIKNYLTKSIFHRSYSNSSPKNSVSKLQPPTPMKKYTSEYRSKLSSNSSTPINRRSFSPSTDAKTMQFSGEVIYLESMIKSKLKVVSVTNFNLFEYISDGVALCKLIKYYNKSCSLTIFVPTPSLHQSINENQKKHNVNYFIQFCVKLGLNMENMCIAEEILSGKPNAKIVQLLLDFFKFYEATY